jgi:hypothetical protein
MGPAADIRLCGPVVDSGVLACRLQGVKSLDVKLGVQNFDANYYLQFGTAIITAYKTLAVVHYSYPWHNTFGHSTPISRPYLITRPESCLASTACEAICGSRATLVIEKLAMLD